MIDAGMRKQLALAAPVSLLYAVTLLVLFALNPVTLAAPMLAAALIAPFVLGLWVFRERPRFSRVVLSFWGPAGEATLIVLVVAVVRYAGGALDFVLGGVVIGPLVLLPALGLRHLRGADRLTRVRVGVLWLLALVEVAVAIPLSGTFGSASEGMASLAAMAMLLFAPAAALGTWGGLALAARLPEPADALVVTITDPRAEDGRQ